MSLIKKCTFYVIMILIIITFTYIPSVLVDRYYEKVELDIALTYKKLRNIEKFRNQSDDDEQRRSYFQSGFEPLFYPNLLRGDSWYRELANELGVAPLAPQPLSKVYYCNEGYGTISYKSDRFGFRNDDRLWETEPEVFVIGDSFVHGACVPESSQTITGNLLDSKRSFNLGTGSNGPIHYAAIAKVFVPQFKPKYAVVVFYPNDNNLSPQDGKDSIYYQHYWNDNKEPYFSLLEGEVEINDDLKEFYSTIKPKMLGFVDYDLQHPAAGISKPSYYDMNVNEIGELAAGENLFFSGINNGNLLLLNLKSQLLANKPTSQLDFASGLAIDTLKQVCVGDCVPLIVYIPNSKLWRPDARAEAYAKNLSQYSKNKNIKFIDSSDALSEFDDAIVYSLKGPHLSPLGYGVVASLIAKKIHD